MPDLPPIDQEYLLQVLVDLLNIPSPTGFAHRAVAYVENALGDFSDLNVVQTRKGALVATWPGKDNAAPRALTAHVDTLGAMVKEIKPNGRLKLTKIGGFAWNTVEGEGCTVFTNKGERIRGSLLFTKASGHVYGGDVNNLKREDDNMEVRLDARTQSAEETGELGIAVGDFVAFDPRVEVTNGFVRSRASRRPVCSPPRPPRCISAITKKSATAQPPGSRTTWPNWWPSIWPRWAMDRPRTNSTPHCASKTLAARTTTN
jgi:putative aminopeptidase FrvX